MGAFNAAMFFFSTAPSHDDEVEPENHPLDFQDTQADEQMVDLFAVDPEWVCVESSQPLAIAHGSNGKART
jgi:hypothetical protein